MPVIFALILSFTAIGSSLTNYEGVYKLVDGGYPECVEWQYIQLHHDPKAQSLLVERLDAMMHSRGWEWLYFQPINGKRQQVEGNFTVSKYVRIKSNVTNAGVRLVREEKHSNMRFLCSRWHRSELIVVTESAVRISLREGVDQCTYQKLVPENRG